MTESVSEEQQDIVQSDINTDPETTETTNTEASDETTSPATNDEAIIDNGTVTNGETATDNEATANGIIPVGPRVECTEENNAIRGITLEKIGTITPQEKLYFSKGDLFHAYADFICTANEDGSFTMCDSEGNEIENCTFTSIDEPYEGYVIVYNEGELIPKSQLMTINGDIIIPFSEICIEFLNERYLKIVVPEEITDNPAEAIMRITDSMLSLSIQEGDVLYKGYVKVFDLKTMEYVNTIELHSNESSVAACGDTLYVKDDHEYNMILDSDGNIITENFKSCEIIGEMYSITFDYENYALYDSNMNKYYAFSAQNSVYKLDNAKFLFETIDLLEDYSSVRGVIDLNGTVLIEPQFNYIYDYNDGLIMVNIQKDGISLYGLCDMSGNMVVPFEYDYITYENGFYKCRRISDGGYVIVNADGKKITESPEAIDYFAYTESKGLFYVLVLNTGEYQMEFEKCPQEIQHAFGFMKAYDRISNSYALFEYVNGTQLTDYAYSDFKYHNGCIYALKDGTYTIYQINYQY